MKKQFLEGGKVCAAHGVRGVLKVASFCDTPKVLASQKRVYLPSAEGYRECRVISASPSGEFVLMHLEGIDDRDAAIAMKNAVLYLAREDIPVGSGCLLADLEGAPVIDAVTGTLLGTVKEILDGVASRLFVVTTEAGEFLIPDVPAFIKEVTPDGIRVTPIPGLLEP